MKDLSAKFLNTSGREKVREAVKKAEANTSGEIVPMVVSASYHYPMADVLGGATLALPVSIFLAYYIGGLLWVGSSNMWVFMGIFCALFILFHQLVQRIVPLKRVFVSDREAEAEVQEAALTGFFEEELYRTREETGVLIFISVFEHKVWVLADRGIDAKVGTDRWGAVVAHIVDGIKKGRQAEAICEAVAEVGEILAAHFPPRDDDIDELDNLIIS